MSNDQKTISYWRRRQPAKAHDIALLRPPSLPAGKRFETVEDAAAESTRSENLLRRGRARRHLIEYLAECRGGDYVCEQTFCPSCARQFRRWLIGEVLRVVDGRPAHVITMLLARSSNIRDLDAEPFRHSLRKRLDRAGLGGAVVIGGFEIVWRAADKDWVLHVNLLVLDASRSAIARFEDSFGSSDFARPTHAVALTNPPEQISYLLKFSTYHRPLRQAGPRRSPAKPLNTNEHVALVGWMWDHSFRDMLFLHRVRRHGDRIKTAS
jgi:hypothetical protein